MKSRTKKPELLAPVGSPDSLIAAINGGADAVYLGLKNFSARSKASNFDFTDLKEALDLAHSQDVKVYITINTLIKDKEIPSLLKTLDQLRLLPVDGLIVQDLGLIYLLKKYYPEFSLQLSTQASVYGKEGARFFDELDFDRVVLARETGIDEVREIKDELETEIKIFNHGALCYAYSGQCHLSSSIGKRSGNRGSCAQPCRKIYSLSKNGKVLKNGYLLSTKDLSTLDRTDDLINSGADSLKIEGRMKSPEYVYTVTKAYRNRLDGKKANDEKEVRAVFNRDFTEGRLFDNRHNLSQENPKKRGELIGKVVSFKDNKVKIKLNPGITVINGDGLSFGEDEASGTYVNAIYNNKGKKVKAGKDTITLKSDLVLKPGISVYRSFNKKLIDNLKAKALAKPSKEKIPVDFYLTIKKDRPVKVTVIKDNESYSLPSSIFPKEALNKSLNSEIIEKQFGKLGNTPYKLGYLHVDLDNNLFLSIKELNDLRRESLSLLEPEEIISEVEDTVIDKGKIKKPVKNQELSIKFETLDQAEEGVNLPVDEVVLTVKDFSDLSPVEKLIKDFKERGVKVLLTTPLVIDTPLSKKILKSGFLNLADNLADGFLIPNFELLEMLKGKDVYKEGDISFNVFNYLSGEMLREFGLDQVVLSDELNEEEILELSKIFPLPTTLDVAGKRLLMVSANCVFDCKTCKNCPNEGFYSLENLNKDKYKLKIEDQKNYIYKAEPTILGSALTKQPYIDKFRIKLTDEDKEEVEDLINNFKEGISREEGNYKKGVS